MYVVFECGHTARKSLEINVNADSIVTKSQTPTLEHRYDLNDSETAHRMGMAGKIGVVFSRTVAKLWDEIQGILPRSAFV